MDQERSVEEEQPVTPDDSAGPIQHENKDVEEDSSTPSESSVLFAPSSDALRSFEQLSTASGSRSHSSPSVDKGPHHHSRGGKATREDEVDDQSAIHNPSQHKAWKQWTLATQEPTQDVRAFDAYLDRVVAVLGAPPVGPSKVARFYRLRYGLRLSIQDVLDTQIFQPTNREDLIQLVVCIEQKEKQAPQQSSLSCRSASFTPKMESFEVAHRQEGGQEDSGRGGPRDLARIGASRRRVAPANLTEETRSHGRSDRRRGKISGGRGDANQPQQYASHARRGKGGISDNDSRANNTYTARPVPPMSGAGKERTSEKSRCWACGGLNHMQWNCPENSDIPRDVLAFDYVAPPIPRFASQQTNNGQAKSLSTGTGDLISLLD